MNINLPECPPTLKSIQPYLKTAAEHDQRDPVVSYWCRLYALQTALTIDKKSDGAKALLLPLMDWLEKAKRGTTNESISSEVAAQAYIENYALKLFVWADNMDRSANYNKNVVKSFYTASLMFDVLTTFGELNEDLVKHRKYAKWKAAYIHNCLKNGETPVPGPMGNDEDAELRELLGGNVNEMSQPPTNQTLMDTGVDSGNSALPSTNMQLNIPENNPYNPHPTPASTSPQGTTYASNGVQLEPSQLEKAQKYCKFASSSLNYDDVPEAIVNLKKALKLLETGED